MPASRTWWVERAQARRHDGRGPRPARRNTVTGQRQRTASPVTFRRRRLVVLGLLVTLLAATGAGSRWLLAADGARSTAPGQGGVAATAKGSPTNHAATAQPRPPAAAKPGGPLTITASGPGHLAPGSDPSVLPGPILIADPTSRTACVRRNGLGTAAASRDEHDHPEAPYLPAENNGRNEHEGSHPAGRRPRRPCQLGESTCRGQPLAPRHPGAGEPVR